MEVAIQLALRDLTLEELVKHGIIVDGLMIRFLPWSAGLIAAQAEATCLEKHLSVARVSLVPQAVSFEPDYPVQNSNLFVAVGCDSQPALYLEFEDFSQLGLKPPEL